MPDESHLDSLYFIDVYKYNCPFCNRRHVSYNVRLEYQFNWTDSKECYVYFVACDSCDMISMHLSYEELRLTQQGSGRQKFETDITDIDSKFFYSVPTSFFVLDTRVPKILRELFAEAEGCLKGNFLTGASACVRKIVYELAKIEKARGENYDDRIKSLKSIKPDVDPAYFDTLLTIQQVIKSTKTHMISGKRSICNYC